MLLKLKSMLSGLVADTEQPRELSLKVATALLLAEVGRADYQWSDDETAASVSRLATFFKLDNDAAGLLLQEARDQADSSVSLHETVDIINRSCDAEEKRQILLDCWRVAFADGVLDKYEEHLIRQLSEWLFLSHQDFIQLKFKADAERT